MTSIVQSLRSGERHITFIALVLAVLLLVFSATTAAAQPITPDQLMRHISVLASDEYEGRKPGTRGGEKAEGYIERAFADAGLRPGAANGSWRQSIKLVATQPGAGSTIWRGTKGPASIPADALIWRGSRALVKGNKIPVVFAGGGTSREIHGINIRGKMVIVTSEVAGPGAEERLARLADAGAFGVVTIGPDSAQWGREKSLHQRERIAPQNNRLPHIYGTISREGALTLAAAGGYELAELEKKAAQSDFRAHSLSVSADLLVRTGIRSFQSSNIVGKIQGKSRAQEAVILLAHWDHLGLCRPEGAPDRICNGAVDNASGVSIVIEVARRIAAGEQPARSIYFLATTGEEMGMLGARAFAAAPPPAIGRIVAALNLDTTALGPRGLPVAIIGRGLFPDLDRVIDATSRAVGRKVDEDTEANIMTPRQDGSAFNARGIPAVMATGSVSDMKLLQAYISGPYHKPSDDLAQKIPLDGAAEDGDLHVALARALADPNIYPVP